MPVPLAFDSEMVTLVGKEGITIAAPSTGRRLVDTPNDRLGNMNIANLTTQAQTLVGVMLKATQDPDFFRVSKLGTDGTVPEGRFAGHTLVVPLAAGVSLAGESLAVGTCTLVSSLEGLQLNDRAAAILVEDTSAS